MKTCLILIHLGLGDLILCNGMIREIKKCYDYVFIPVKKHNLNNFIDLFKDDKSIKFLICESDNDALLYKNHIYDNVIKVGIFSDFYSNNNVDFCETFYKQANISYNKRWDSFYYQRNIEKENELFDKLVYLKKDYVFVHQDIERNMKINIESNKIICPNHKFGEINNFTIFNHIKVLENAKEIHCIDSSFACFIDHVPSLKNTPKFIHRYVRKHNENPVYKNNWNILNESRFY